MFSTKARTAMKHGAAGMILVTDPRHHEGADDLRINGRLRLPPEPKKADGQPDARRGRARSGPPSSFLAVHVSKETAEAIVLPSGKSLTDLQKAIDDGAKPKEIALPGVKATIAVKELANPQPVTAQNVIGFLRGSDPKLADEWILIGAHYDHLGAFAGSGDTIYNGADDNASGTSGMLELAEAFANMPQPPRRSIVFAGFSGEEKGLLGSRATIEQKLLPVDKLVFMLNLDMIGRNPKRPVEVVGDGFATGLRQAIEVVNDEVDNLPLEFGGTEYAANSDHHPFFVEGIPVLFFFTGTHDDYHQLSDHVDKLAFDRMTKITRLGFGLVAKVASGELSPRFIHHVTWLGVAIQAFDDEAGKRAVITDVEADSRAAKLGLQMADVIKAFGEAALEDPTKVGSAFADLEPGAKVVLHIDREGVAVQVEIERAKRGYLGVMPDRLEDEARKKLGLADDEGVVIAGLAGDGPAGKAGIKEGDVLIRISGLPVGPRTLGRRLARIGAGETVKIVVVRDGARITLELTLGERPKMRRRRP